MVIPLVAQAPAPSGGNNLFFYSLVFIFLAGIITTIVTKWAKDKCLKFFNRYHVTLERAQGQTSWGTLRVFSSGIEIVFDHPYVDLRGHKKTSYLFYQQDVDAQLLSIFRYHNELTDETQKQRAKQIHRTFNPGAIRRFFRKIRNIVNTLRDAFSAALGAVIGQYQKMNPATSVVSSQSGQVTQIGQTLLDKFGNAYEPLLEQYIGQPVILEIADPRNPGGASNEFTGYLADYTQNYVAVFNAKHVAEKLEFLLPDVEHEQGTPAVPGVPPIPPAPLKEENQIAVFLEGERFKIRNQGTDFLVVRQLNREGMEPLNLGVTIPPHGVLDLPTRDAHGAKMLLDRVQCLDIVAPRKFAIVRHAGKLLPRPTLVDDLALGNLNISRK